LQGNRGLPGERGDKGMKGRGGLAGTQFLLKHGFQIFKIPFNY